MNFKKKKERKKQYIRESKNSLCEKMTSRKVP